MNCKKRRCFGIILVIVLIVIGSICYCPHKVTYTKIIKEATCFEIGQKEEKKEYVCVHEINPEEKWTYVKYATPFEKGERYKNCYLCGAILSEFYTIPKLENNSIYITNTDINAKVAISSFTQGAVDRYDIVYTEATKLGLNNPFVLGHNYRTLGLLYQTAVGEHIYLYINEILEIYEVVVSEYGLQNSSRNDIIGQTTGTSIWDSYDGKTLHMYTCYGSKRNGRWIVLAKKIS